MSRTCCRAALAALALLAVPACVREEPPLVTGTTSVRVSVTAPSDLGSEEQRLPDTARDVSVAIEVLDAQGAVDTGFNGTLDLYTYYLGTLSPQPTDIPNDPIPIEVVNGVATADVTLPRAFGATYLWVEDAGDGDAEAATWATGTSPTLWYREPLLEDISTPDLTRPSTWLERSPLEGKQVLVDSSKHGANGHLVVTGVYAQGYTMSDVDCSTTPCTADPYSHVFVFTFGRPRDEEFVAIEVGQEIDWVSGGIGEFNGFTELNFPQTKLLSATPNPALLPAPVELDPAWFGSPTSDTGMINLEELESAVVSVSGKAICPLDDEYDTYNQWKLDLTESGDCDINVISAGQVSGFDPAQFVGTQVSVTGTLRAVNIGSFSVWILYPRTDADIVF